jgi:TIR domain-containing protein
MKTVDYDAILDLLIRLWKNETLDGQSHKNCWQLARIIEEKFPDINYAELKLRPENFRSPLAGALEELVKTDIEAHILIRNLTGEPVSAEDTGRVNQKVEIGGENNHVILAGRDIVGSIEPRRTKDANEKPPQEQPLSGPTRLRVFLCHSSTDKPRVRELCNGLRSDGFSPWLDEEQLAPGQQWALEIERIIKGIDAFIVCLSKHSVDKRGYVQKEIKMALDVADEIPEGGIFIIPLKLEECEIPDRLSKWHWEYFDERGYAKLVQALRQIAAKSAL